MRERWQRGVPPLSPGAEAVAAMVREAVPGARVAGFAALDGGLLNTNLRVDLEGGRVLLRLYQHDPAQAGKEAAIARRLHGLVPVPRYLHLGMRDGQRFAVLEWVAGEPLHRVLEDAEARVALGRETGAVLARIHGVHFAQSGFLDARLEIVRPFVADKAFLVDYLRGSLVEGGGARFVPRELVDAVMAYAERYGDLAWGGPHCLVHSDFNGTNILVRDGRIVGVLDWEFAFAGPPSADFGNLMRNHPHEDFLGAVEAGYRDSGGHLPGNWRRLAGVTDLIAWADMLQRPRVDPAVVEDALRSMRETVSAR
ncbi:MAG: aminoglycoside phosphotransferase family protein [Rhizomicrobium sp.]